MVGIPTRQPAMAPKGIALCSQLCRTWQGLAYK